MLEKKQKLNDAIRRVIEKEIIKKTIDYWGIDETLREVLKKHIDNMFIEVDITSDDKIFVKASGTSLDEFEQQSIIQMVLEGIVGPNMMDYQGVVEYKETEKN